MKIVEENRPNPPINKVFFCPTCMYSRGFADFREPGIQRCPRCGTGMRQGFPQRPINESLSGMGRREE